MFIRPGTSWIMFISCNESHSLGCLGCYTCPDIFYYGIHPIPCQHTPNNQQFLIGFRVYDGGIGWTNRVSHSHLFRKFSMPSRNHRLGHLHMSGMGQAITTTDIYRYHSWYRCGTKGNSIAIQSPSKSTHYIWSPCSFQTSFREAFVDLFM